MLKGSVREPRWIRAYNSDPAAAKRTYTCALRNACTHSSTHTFEHAYTGKIQTRLDRLFFFMFAVDFILMLNK